MEQEKLTENDWVHPSPGGEATVVGLSRKFTFQVEAWRWEGLEDQKGSLCWSAVNMG